MYAAGYESSDELSDEYGFYCGDEFETKNRKNVLNINTGTSYKTKSDYEVPKGGFGQPPNSQVSHASRKMVGTGRRAENGTTHCRHNTDEFKDAVTRGSLQQVEEIIKSGMSVNETLKCHWTVLMYAANMALPNKMAFLIEKGANVNYHRDHFNVLMAACACNRGKQDEILRCVQILIDSGVDVNAYDRYHSTALMIAAREGHDQVVRKLIECGADVNKQNNRGWTALSWAVCKGNVAIVEILLNANADKEKVHTDGQRVIDLALHMGCSQIANLLGYRGDVDGSAGDTVVDSNNVSGSHDYSNKAYQVCGELEMFLSGLNLSSMLEVFHKHKITFEMLLCMTDDDLKEMGISELGNRKQILKGICSVHKKDWEESSLPDRQDKKNLSYAEALAMMTNISKHLKYIVCTVAYINTHTRGRAPLLDQSPDGLGPTSLQAATSESLTNISSLEDELKALRARCQVALKKGHFKSPDIIEKADLEVKPSRGKYIKYYIGITCSVVLGISFRKPLVSAISSLSSHVQQAFVERFLTNTDLVAP